MYRKKISILVSLVLCSACLSVSSAFGQSAFTPTAQNILGRWTKALGGRDKIERIKNIYRDGTTMEGGLHGKLEEWSTAEGQHKRVYERIGVDSTLTVYDGRRGWTRDWNGKVHDLQGADLENEIAEAYQASDGFLIPGRFKAKVEFLGIDAAGESYVLRFSPKGGRVITYFIDKSSFLPIRSERLSEDNLLTTRFSDWREVDGIKVSFSVRRSTGEDKYATTITLRKVSFNLVNFRNAFAKPQESAHDARFTHGNNALRIPFKRNNNFIMLQGRINDSMPLWFILDTGASITVINKDRAAQLGLLLKGELEIGTSAATTSFSIVDNLSFAFIGAGVINQRAGAISLSLFEAGLGLPMGGVLGFDFISRFVMEIDFDAQVINLYEPDTYRYRGRGTIIPFSLEAGKPFIQATIAVSRDRSLAGRLEIDTGDTKSIYLNAPFVREHKLIEPAASSQKVSGSKGTNTNYINSLSVNGRVAKLTIGPFTINNVPAGFSLGETGFVANPDYAGLLGNAILSRFKATFDYSRKQMILEPNLHFRDPFKAQRTFGVLIIAQGADLKTFLIARVTSDSPAEKAGLRRGDIITAIDATPSTAVTLEQVNLFLNQEGRKYLLTIRRGVQILKLPVEIKLTTVSQQ